MKRGWLIVGLLLSLGLNLGLVGVAVARRVGLERWERVARGEAPPPSALGRRLAERLGVPEDRREAFLDVQRRLLERTVETRREIGRARLELRRELLAPRPDRARVETLLDELARLEEEMNRAFVEGVLDSRETLAPRELELYLRFLERAGPGMGPRGGPGGGMPPGAGPRRPFERP